MQYVISVIIKEHFFFIIDGNYFTKLVAYYVKLIKF